MVVTICVILFAVGTARYRTTSRVSKMIVALWVLMLAVNTPVLTKYSAIVDQLTELSHCVIASEATARQLYATFFVFAYLIVLRGPAAACRAAHSVRATTARPISSSGCFTQMLRGRPDGLIHELSGGSPHRRIRPPASENS